MSVKQYQQALKNAGFDPGPIDGIRGPKTIAAIKAFQKAKGLVVDGIVGPKTTAALGGGGGASQGNPTAASTPTIDQEILAQQYGFALAVLNSDPDLKRIFNAAVANSYTADRFIAEIRGTNWYKQHGEAWRNASVLKASDPATYNTRLDYVKTRIAMMASELGAVVSPAQLATMSEQAFMLGWDENQLRQNLGTYVQYVDGRMLGQAGQWETEMREWARANGVRLSDDWYRTNISSAIGGKQAINDVRSAVTNMAVSAFPHLADRLRAGETVETIADPYKQTMANLLELNPEEIDLFDPTIRGALQSKAADGKVALRTLYDFENDMRTDKRWLKTKNAQDSAMSTVNRVLRDMGVIS